MGNLDDLRSRLDGIDRELVQALASRQDLVKKISNLKKGDQVKIRDLQREEVLLGRIRGIAAEFALDPTYVEHLFREVILNSVRYQTQSLVDTSNGIRGNASIKVAYQGTTGAYSHLAASRHFSHRFSDVEFIGFDKFTEAARAVIQGDVTYGFLPIENTTAGSINDTYDILGSRGLYIIGEEILKVVHCLLAVEAVQLGQIRRVISHPQAIAQCSNFLGGLPRCKVESYTDTAMSAQKVMEDADLSQAAIAGAHTAELYRLQVIAHDIANNKRNYTRFVVVAPEAVLVDSQIPCKTSLKLVTKHSEGALIRCLSTLHEYGINMAKLESRPLPEEPWKYQFYLDIDGNIQDDKISRALEEVRKDAESVEFLGCYPKQEMELKG